MLLLALETAADVCGAALHDGRAVIAESSLRVARRHSAALLPLCDTLLAAAGHQVSGVTAVAVSAGPGSYTGLRIGASVAKGLCTATGAVLVPVPTLDALADQATAWAREGDVIVAALPSRRGEVYASAYRWRTGDLELVHPAGALTLDQLPPGWLGASDASTVFAGPAAAALHDAFGFPHATLLSADAVRPSAAAVARLGIRRLEAGSTADAAAFEPDYLKAFVATRPKPIFSAA